ncbi:hypothetical protein WJ973_12295 [Achromobacter xylosoxidans]
MITGQNASSACARPGALGAAPIEEIAAAPQAIEGKTGEHALGGLSARVSAQACAAQQAVLGKGAVAAEEARKAAQPAAAAQFRGRLEAGRRAACTSVDEVTVAI